MSETMGNMEPDEYRQQRCPHGCVDATQCEPCRTTIECDALRTENALLRDALRRYIRLYRVDDQAWDVGAETERLMRIELTPNVEHNRRAAASSLRGRVDGPVGPHTQED